MWTTALKLNTHPLIDINMDPLPSASQIQDNTYE